MASIVTTHKPTHNLLMDLSRMHSYLLEECSLSRLQFGQV
jgi:hypothetical protein